MENKLSITPYIVLAIAMIGLGDTLYLAYFQYLNIVPACAISGCDVVLTSVYAKFLGIPLSYLGVVYYSYMFCLGVLLAIEPDSRALRIGALAYGSVGFVLSFIFVFYIQLTLIGAICQYCAMSALTTTAFFATAIWHWRMTKQKSL